MEGIRNVSREDTAHGNSIYMKITFDPITETTVIEDYLEDKRYRNALMEFKTWLRDVRKHRSHHRHIARVLDIVWAHYIEACNNNKVDWNG